MVVGEVMILFRRIGLGQLCAAPATLRNWCGFDTGSEVECSSCQHCRFGSVAMAVMSIVARILTQIACRSYGLPRRRLACPLLLTMRAKDQSHPYAKS